MKKIIILLMLTALCFGLCACGEDLTSVQVGTVCGTWYLQPKEQKGDNPGYFRLEKDGTGSFNGAEPISWVGQRNRDEEAYMTVTITMESEEAHTLSFYAGDPNHREAWLTMGEETVARCYYKADTEISAPWFQNLLTRQWYPAEDGLLQSVVINDNATVTIEDRTYFWTKSEKMSGDDSAYLYLYDENGVWGELKLGDPLDNNAYVISVTGYQRNPAVFWGFDHPVLGWMGNDYGSWVAFDRYTMIADSFVMGTGNEITIVSDREYRIRFDTKLSQDTVTAHLLEGEDVRYEAEIYMDGEYPMLTLTDCQTGNQTLYYNSAYGYDENNVDALYYGTLDLIYRYANGECVYTLETNEALAPEKSLSYIYEKLTALGDYRQTGEFLARFHIVPDKLTAVIRYATDDQGNVHETPLSRYGYDENGVMIWGQGEDIIEKYGVNTGDVQWFTYDAKGKIAGIKAERNGVVTAVGTPIFDTVGKLVGMHVQGEDTEYTTVYTYGKGQRIIRMGVSKSESYYPLVYEYSYDDDGRLETKVIKQGNSFVATGTYTYINGELAKIVQGCWKYGSPYTNTYYFINDEQGRPLSVEFITGDPDLDYGAYEIKYIYEDLYFFDTTGLVIEENKTETQTE